MSKSLKNFITIRQALENNTARQLRILFLLQDWDKPMNYSDQTVEDARSKESTLKVFFREIEALMRHDYLVVDIGWRMPAEDRQLAEDYLATQQAVHSSLLDNFNTKSAMLALLDIVAKVNVYVRVEGVKPAVLLLRSIAVYVTQILRVFGVVTGADDFGFDSTEGGSGEKDTTEPIIESLVSFRERVRNAALAAAKGNGEDAQAAIRAIMEQCDHLRDEVLPTVGVRLEDRPAGPRWNREDPADMLRELAEKKTREKEMRISKLEKTLVTKEKELEKVKTSMVKPEDLFRTDEFKEWDESGVPVILANGEPVSKGQMKKSTKAVEKQAKAYQDLMAKCDSNPQPLLDAIQLEIDGIKDELVKLSL
jgi:cysteinyl-tRNA synthetase